MAVLDDDRRARQCGQIGDLIPQPAVGQAGDQIGQRFAFDAGHQYPVDLDAVVATRKRLGDEADLREKNRRRPRLQQEFDRAGLP